MKKTVKNILYVISESLELPEDIVMNLPKITLIGDLYIVIENHQGIIEYTETKIRINTRSGELIIYGEVLEIKVILSEEIIINGRISGIEISQ